LLEVKKVPGGYKVYNPSTKQYYSNKPQTKEEATAQMKHIESGMAKKLLTKGSS
jgi:hypothetical protein